MTSPNRVGGEGSTRSLLVNSTERIMLEEGYAAVSYRNVAAKAGVSLGAVQYHFPSLDDLFKAVVRQYSERTLETLVSALQANPGDVLRVLWECSGDEISAGLQTEIMALVNHRKSIHAEIAEFAQVYRKVQLDAVTENWENLDLPARELTPAAIVFLMTCLPRWMRMEASFGMVEGGADVLKLVLGYLDRTDPALNRFDGPASYRLPASDTTLHLLRERAESSAKAVAHYTRMGWKAWARRDERGNTDQ